VYAVLFCGLVTAGLYCGYLAYTTIREFAAHTQFKAIPPIILAPTAQPDKAPVRPEQPAGNPQSGAKSVIIPDTDAKERVNILVLGIDQRPGEAVDCRTDTMMLVSLNPKDMSVSILSIPRDLWLEIPHPNHEKDRINTAHYWGETESYPGGGPALAMKTVQYNFGVPVHYYVRLNFVGFERMIDYIGGIDVEVPVTIDDEKYPTEDNGYEHLYIPAGRNHFDGAMALKYARTRRGTGDGDFSRMERQQQVILAILDKVSRLKNLPQLIGQSPNLLREMGDSVETNIPVNEMFALAQLGQQVARDDIQTAAINRDMTDDWWTPNGELVLLYDRTKARPVIDDLFSDPTPVAEVTQTSPAEQLGAEHARIAVYNGTTVDGLAANIQSFLTMQGMDVIRIGNADRADYGRTIIRVYGDKSYTTEWLSGWLTDMGIPDPLIERPIATSDIDIAIIIGTDFPADKIN
jgi:LCP family protein required for cell wall assembly